MLLQNLGELADTDRPLLTYTPHQLAALLEEQGIAVGWGDLVCVCAVCGWAAGEVGGWVGGWAAGEVGGWVGGGWGPAGNGRRAG